MSVTVELQRERWRRNTRKYRRTEKGRIVNRRKAQKYRDAHPEKRAAHRAVELAMDAGKITKPDICEHSTDCEGRIEAHHPDYSKPLEVRWLCIKHHKEEHPHVTSS